MLILIPVGMALNLAISFIFTDTSYFLKIQYFSVGYFSIAVLLSLIPWFTRAFRLLNWMHFLRQPFGFLESMRVIITCELGAAISPTALGGGPVKAGYLINKGLPVGEAASVMSLTSVEDLTFFAIGVPIAFALTPAIHIPVIGRNLDQIFIKAGWILGIILGLVILVFIADYFYGHLNFFRKMKRKLAEYWEDFKGLYQFIARKGKLRFVVNVILAGIQWTAYYMVVVALIHSLGIQVDPVKYFILQWVVFTLMTLIPTPGATGGAETSFLIIYSGIIPHKIIGLIMIGWRFLTFYFLNTFAILLLSIGGFVRKLGTKSANLSENSTDLRE